MVNVANPENSACRTVASQTARPEIWRVVLVDVQISIKLITKLVCITTKDAAIKLFLRTDNGHLYTTRAMRQQNAEQTVVLCHFPPLEDSKLQLSK